MLLQVFLLGELKLFLGVELLLVRFLCEMLGNILTTFAIWETNTQRKS